MGAWSKKSALLLAELAHALVANRIVSARGIETVHHIALQEQLGGVAVNWFGKGYGRAVSAHEVRNSKPLKMRR
jgi:hypothetical protein